jgi:predicted nucleic acid-binding protein
MELDNGEAEAIALAVEIQADRILIDERRGRKKAIELSLRPIGVLGILLRAK